MDSPTQIQVSKDIEIETLKKQNDKLKKYI